MTELPKTGNRRVDLAMQLIFDSTGMDPQKFLNLLSKSNKKVKLQAASNDDISDALRLLALPKSDDKVTAFKNIFRNPDQRKQRSTLFNYYLGDENLNNFATIIKNEFADKKPRLQVSVPNVASGFGSTQPIPITPFSDETLKKFAALYNTENPFLLKSLSTLTGDSSFNALQKQIKKQNLISKSAAGLYRDLSRVKDFEFDSIVDRSEKLLRVYKELISDATGRELKLGPNSLGEIDINKVLQADPVIAQYIKIKGKGTQRDIASGLGINSAAVRKIMNQLNREGTIKEIGLDEYFLKGGIPKAQKIVDPKIIQFMKDQAMSKLNIKTDDLTQILNTKQLSYYGDLRKKINEIVTPLSFKPLMSEFRKSPKTFYKGVDDIVTQTFNRMLTFGIRQGKSVDDVFKSFQNQVEDPDFLNKVVPLMLRKVKKQDEISYYNTKYGLDIDDLHFSHKKRVVDDIDLTFKIFNVFNGTAKKNLQAEALQKQINNLQTILNAKGGKKLVYNEEVEKRLEREIKDLKFELDNGGYFDSAELEYESLNPENIAQIVTAQGQMFKDGGFASIEDVLDYRNG